MTDTTECECSEDYGPCEDHCTIVFSFDTGRMSTDDHAALIAAEVLTAAPDDDAHHGARAKVRQIAAEVKTARYAMFWAQRVADTEEEGDRSQELSEACYRLEDMLGEFGWSGGFNSEAGTFSAEIITGGPFA